MSAAVVAAIVAASTPAGATPGAARPDFAAARIRWLSEADLVSSALQNVPLISAVHDLELGLARGGNTAGYRGAIATMTNFGQIPITSETPAQVTASHRDWDRLNSFFDVGPSEAAVLRTDYPAGALVSAAARQFNSEPATARHGVRAPALRRAREDLRRAARRTPSRAILYTAAIADLADLAGARGSDLVATPSLLDHYDQDIDYLNVFFDTQRLLT